LPPGTNRLRDGAYKNVGGGVGRTLEWSVKACRKGIPERVGEKPSHPTPTGEIRVESGQILGKMCADKGFSPGRLCDLHFDVLIALTARSYGARLITSSSAGFELIRE
jgi:hypothetical protein